MWDAIALALLIAGHNREATLVFGSAVLKYKRQFSTGVGIEHHRSQPPGV
jgi:hypothetical protein